MSKSCQFVKHYVAVLPKFGKNAVKLQKLAWCCQILNCKQQNLVNVTVPKNIQYSGVHSLYKILLLETIKNMTDKKWHLRITKTYWWVTSEEQLKSDFFKASLHQIQVSVIIIYKPTSSFHDWLPYLWFFREYLQTLRSFEICAYWYFSGYYSSRCTRSVPSFFCWYLVNDHKYWHEFWKVNSKRIMRKVKIFFYHN